MAGETGDGYARNLAGGFVPRHAKSCAAAGALGVDEDTTYEGQNARGFRVGVAGDVTVTTEEGPDVTVYSVQPGEFVYIAFSKIESSTTTAQKITYFFA